MGFDMHGEIHLLDQTQPAFGNANGFRQRARADIGLDVDVVNAECGAPFQCRLERVNVRPPSKAG